MVWRARPQGVDGWLDGWMDGWEQASTTWWVTEDARVSDQEPNRDGRRTKPGVDERQRVVRVMKEEAT